MSAEHDRETALRLAARVAEEGGRAYYVGGCVRDSLLGRACKDLDIEVHGLTPGRLASILDELGGHTSMGADFGIFGLKGCDLDIAMPRRENATGRGHRDFEVYVDPFLGPEKAALRRDFTVNALMQDVLTGELLDFYGGCADLQAGILRHVSADTFPEDPLRVLRCAQFAARFGFTAAEETIGLCRGIDLSALSPERVLEELKKALLKSDRPSVFFRFLREADGLAVWFPEAAALIGVEQNPRFHAEGDVWNHTMLVLDNAVQYRDRAQNPLGFMLAALCHDFGKPATTEFVKGALHAYGHEKAGLPVAETFLRRITNETKLIRYVLNLVELHMKPGSLAAAGASVKSTNKMFDEALDPEALICLSLADGQSALSEWPFVSAEWWHMERLAVYREYMSRPAVTGRELMEAGFTPGPAFSEALSYAHKLQLAGIEHDNALKQTIGMLRSKK